MSHFPELGLKIAIATGPARRFVVGDPQIHYVDTLAGATVSRTATGEHLANKGEVLLDEATVKRLGRR
jgi:class 3 adenylate cyclase